jgi:peptide/nickel transport system permease protein
MSTQDITAPGEVPLLETEEIVARVSQSPGRLAWRQLRRNRVAMLGGIVLCLLYLSALFADFLAPYPVSDQRLDLALHPPTPLSWHDAQGRFSLRPYGLDMKHDFANDSYVVDPAGRGPMRFFVRGYPYRLLGILPLNIHLFGSDHDHPIFLLGTDDVGRDAFSRLLLGSQISLSVGLVAILITFTIGLFVGGISGYYGGRVDNVLMRLCEVLMSVPSFYLLLALAAVLPANLSPAIRYMLIIVILSFVNWAALARVIRGISLSTRQREYVEAARALGVSDIKIIRRHIIPSAFTFAIVTATLTVPGYIMGEAGLSFLGLGIQAPMPSWGNMLSAAQDLMVLTRATWLLTPGFLIFITVIAFNFLGDGLRDALDPKLRK